MLVTPEVHKPADTPAATANGDAAAHAIAPGAPAALASNGTGVNGSGGKFESLVPEETKQASLTAPASATDKPASSIFGGASAPGVSSTSAQPPVMAGALSAGDPGSSTLPVPKPAESTEKDGVEDVTGASAVPKAAEPTQTDGIESAAVGSTATSDAPAAPAAASSTSAPKPSVLNGAESKDAGIDAPATSTVLGEKKDDEKKKDAVHADTLPSAEKPSTAISTADAVEEDKDVEMKDAASIPAPEKPLAPAPTPVTGTAPATDISGVSAPTAGAPTTTPALATPSTAVQEATGGKRKAETDAEEPAGAPAAKKQKGAFSRAMDKAKEAVKDVKDKAKPGRKPGKREKKEIAPVGRTERKTRSQARAE